MYLSGKVGMIVAVNSGIIVRLLSIVDDGIKGAACLYSS